MDQLTLGGRGRSKYLLAFLSIMSVIETFDFQRGRIRWRDSLKRTAHYQRLAGNKVKRGTDVGSAEDASENLTIWHP